jgi:hypothetical protein
LLLQLGTTVTVVSTAEATSAYEVPTSSFVDGGVGFSTSSNYFSTQANYEKSRGEYTGLPTGNKLTHWENQARVRYNPASRFSLIAGTTYTSTFAQMAATNKTNSRMTEIMGGIDWLLYTGYLQVTLEWIASYPLDLTDPAQLVPMTNDGVAYFRPGVFLQKSFRRYQFNLYTGFHAPVQNFATRFLYETSMDMRLFWIFTVGGGINGYETILSDSSNLIYRQSSAALSNVGSERFYSFNPALVEARAWIGIRPNKHLWLRVGYAQTINGLHNAAGNSILFSLAYNTATPVFGEYYPPLHPRKSSPGDAVRSFEPDAEPLDQSVFEMDDDETDVKSKGKNPLDKTEQILENRNQDK